MPQRLALSFAVALVGAGVIAAASASAQPAPGDVVTFGDWKKDAPGVRHHITVDDLPAPSKGVAAPVTVVAAAPGALPKVPAGFTVATFATGMEGPRAMTIAPNGDIFVSEQPAGRVRVLRPAPGGAKASHNADFADGLEQPFGIAFYPLGSNPQWVQWPPVLGEICLMTTWAGPRALRLPLR